MLVSDDTSVANELNTFFANVTAQKGCSTVSNQLNSTQRRSPVHLMVLSPVSEGKVRPIIIELPEKKNQNDLIYMSTCLLKKCFERILKPLSKLNNLSFQAGVVMK